METNRLPGESFEQYIWRIGNAKDNGLINLSWEQLAPIFNANLFADASEYLGESAYRKRYKYARDMHDRVFSQIDSRQDIDDQIRELKKERQKLSTEKLEYNRWLREDARDELIAEQIAAAIDRLEPMRIPAVITPMDEESSYLLVFSDAHYGAEFEIPSFFDGVMNSYSPEVFEYRMGELLDSIISLIQQNKISHIDIWDLGDGIHGILRLNSQLMKLRYGIIDSTIRYAEYVATWLNELSHYTSITFQMVEDSNHAQLRICGAPKNAFAEENMSKVMMNIISRRLLNNPNIKIIDMPTGLNYSIMSGWGVLGCHGEHKNRVRAFDDYRRNYNININYCVAGHSHHSVSEEIGRNYEVMHVRSIMGVDDYGLSCGKSSDPGASVFVFTKRDGLVCEHKIKLH